MTSDSRFHALLLIGFLMSFATWTGCAIFLAWFVTARM